jgi:hypothetical protein
MSFPKHGPTPERHRIALHRSSAFSANLLAGMLCGFFSVKRKLHRLWSAFKQLFSVPPFPFDGRDSHFTGVKPPKTFPFMSKITLRVFACPSQRL